jgi:opacity protein-like surface antigen
MEGGKALLLLLVAWCALIIIVPTPCFAQMYVGIYGGAAFPLEAETSAGSLLLEKIANEGAEDGVVVSSLSINVSDTEFDAGWMIGGRVGYWLQEYPFLALEGDLSWSFPKISRQSAVFQTSFIANGTQGSPTVEVPIESADLQVTTLGINIIARYPYSTIQPFVGVGFGLVGGFVDDVKLSNDVTFSVDGTTFTLEGGEDIYKLKSDDDWVGALQLIGGVRGFIHDNVALFVEYKYVTTEFEFHPIKLDYDTSHVYGGIELFFGPGVVKRD